MISKFFWRTSSYATFPLRLVYFRKTDISLVQLLNIIYKNTSVRFGKKIIEIYNCRMSLNLYINKIWYVYGFYQNKH
jgi:hypothetical protein